MKIAFYNTVWQYNRGMVINYRNKKFYNSDNWWTDDWSDCSATCGHGFQRRNVRCVGVEEDDNEEETDAEVS